MSRGIEDVAAADSLAEEGRLDVLTLHEDV
jgi:hypothetical protein